MQLAIRLPGFGVGDGAHLVLDFLNLCAGRIEIAGGFMTLPGASSRITCRNPIRLTGGRRAALHRDALAKGSGERCRLHRPPKRPFSFPGSAFVTERHGAGYFWGPSLLHSHRQTCDARVREIRSLATYRGHFQMVSKAACDCCGDLIPGPTLAQLTCSAAPFFSFGKLPAARALSRDCSLVSFLLSLIWQYRCNIVAISLQYRCASPSMQFVRWSPKFGQVAKLGSP